MAGSLGSAGPLSTLSIPQGDWTLIKGGSDIQKTKMETLKEGL